MEYEDTLNAQKEANEEEAALQRGVAVSQVKFDGVKVGKLEEYRGELLMDLDTAAPCDEMLAQLMGAT